MQGSARLLCIYMYISVSLAIGGDITLIPRITQPHRENISSFLPQVEPYAVFHLSAPHSLYVGGQEKLYYFNFNIMENYMYIMKAENGDCKGKPYCDNHVTFIGQLEGKLLVCGTNAYNPSCWNLINNKLVKVDLAEEFAPQKPGTNYNILITGNQSYSTIVRQTNNGKTKKPRFRKIHGNDPMLYTEEKLMKNPYYVKSLVVAKEKKDQDKILLFFRDDNREPVKTEPRVSMVAQLCKDEAGPDSSASHNVFSTALKSRLICGTPEATQYYHNLQDIFFLKSKEVSQVYALFTNAWNHSAVCTYNLEDIERVFSSPSLVGYNGKEPKILPGMCPQPGEKTPDETFLVVSEYPELTQSVMPSRNKALIQTLYHYTKMVVDEIKARDGKTYRVIILATGDGKVHKIVELAGGPLNVLEMNPLKKPEEILYMELEPTEHVLYLGTTKEVARLSLDDCSAYSQNCENCVRSHDPYCYWNGQQCQSILKSEISKIQQMIKKNSNSQCVSKICGMWLRFEGDMHSSLSAEVHSAKTSNHK
ncbi:semaphorin-7A isoform 2-T2 [Discoglossus pictus]